MHIYDPSAIILVFSAGIFALFSPCAYPLLPGYILYYIGKHSTLHRALLGSSICTLGLITIFSIFGLLGSVIGTMIHTIASWLVIVAGIIIIIMGASMLLGIKFPTLFIPVRASGRKGFIGMYLYGLAYGLATFGCSSPIFFSILLLAIISEGIFAGLVVFLIYSIGMGIPLILTTLLLVVAKDIVHKKVFKIMPLIEKIGGAVLIIIGIYLLYYYYFATPTS